MKSIKIILALAFMLCGLASVAQRPLLPNALPSPNSKGYYRLGYAQADSGFLYTSRDTNFTPKFPCIIYWQQTGIDSSFWGWNSRRWFKIGEGAGGILAAHTHTFASLTSKPTTISGYGITDAVPTGRTISINGVTQDLSLNRSWVLDFVPPSRTITINGTTLDLSANRSWTISTTGLTALAPIFIASSQIRADTSFANAALVTRWRMKQYFDSVSSLFGFVVAEGLIGIAGNTINDKDTVIIQDNGITNGKLGTDIKVGSLASLATTDKTSVVAAINEVRGSITTGNGEEVLWTRTFTNKDTLNILLTPYYATYDEFKLTIIEVTTGASFTDLVFRVRFNGSSTFVTAADTYIESHNSGLGAASGHLSTPYIPLFFGMPDRDDNPDRMVHGNVWFSNPFSTTARFNIAAAMYGTNNNGSGGAAPKWEIGGATNAAGRVDEIQILVTGGGTSISGKIKLKGVKN